MIRPFSDNDLHAFVDGQIDPETRDAIALYLRTAPEDAARVELWRKQNATIKALFAGAEAEAVPLWLTVGQITSGQDRPIPLAKRPPVRPSQPVMRRNKAQVGTVHRSPSPLAVAILALAVGLALPSGLARLSGVERLAPFLPAPTATLGFRARAWEAHTLFGTDPERPVDVLDAPEGSLETWLGRHVPFDVTVPNLRGEGWTLRGGRIVPADQGAGALLVYDDGAGHRLSLFMSRLKTALGAPPLASANDLIAWEQGGVGYALMTTRPSPWLNRHEGSLRAVVQADIAR